MKNRPQGTADWQFWPLAIAVAVSVIYLTCEALLPRRPLDKTEFEVFLSVLAIIVTASSTVAALWLANRGERRADEVSFAAARVVAARTYRTLNALVDEVGAVCARFDFADDPVRDNLDAITHILRLQPATLPISNETIYSLVPLGDNCATQIANALTELQSLHNEAYSYLASRREDEPERFLIRRAHRFSEQLDNIFEMLRSAATKCERAVGARELVPPKDDIF